MHFQEKLVLFFPHKRGAKMLKKMAKKLVDFTIKVEGWNSQPKIFKLNRNMKLIIILSCIVNSLMIFIGIETNFL